MLTYSYKFKISDNTETIGLSDFYISPDLSMISGTTDTTHNLATGQKLWVTTPYYPEKMAVAISYAETVKRNGYVLNSIELPIKSTILVSDENNGVKEHKTVKYVEYNGNIYYQDIKQVSNLVFFIEGEYYYANSSDVNLKIWDRAYVENNQVIIDDVTYNVLINTNDDVALTDSLGNSFIPSSSSCDLSHVSLSYEYVQKIRIENKSKTTYGVNFIKLYGYVPYIVYNGQKMYFHDLYDENNEIYAFGLNIDSKNYIPYNYENHPYSLSFDPYDKSLYYNFLVPGNAVMLIDDIEYQIYFELGEVGQGRTLCLDMENENLPILVGDRLIVEDTSYETYLPVFTETATDSEGNETKYEYVFVDGNKIYKTKNLCSKVTIETDAYEITFSGDCSTIQKGMLCYCKVDDGNTFYFMVGEQTEGIATEWNLTRVKLDANENWQTVNSITNDDSLGPTYGPKPYKLNSYDGFLVNDQKCTVESFALGKSASDKIIRVSTKLKHYLIVKETVGSNKLLCVPYVDSTKFDSETYTTIVNYELSTILMMENYIVSKRPNTFGVKELTADNWLSELDIYSQNSDYPLSVVALSKSRENIRLEKLKGYTTLPITLSKCIDNNLNSSDLITSYHYNDKAEELIPSIVDMDKDIYMPVYTYTEDTSGIESEKTSEIQKITFNFHFRTRDLENWVVNTDEGESDDGTKLSINNDFCNWFITDYYPYNQVLNTGNTSSIAEKKEGYLNNCMNRSDLLGFLYFTTNDVEEKREKLTGSFLRISYYDAKNPDTQNMLGTSTIFLNGDRYDEILYNYTKKNHYYVKTAQSKNPNRTNSSGSTEDKADANKDLRPTVLTESFEKEEGASYIYCSGLTTEVDDNGYLPVLDSRIVLKNRYLTNTSSEGFYTYILKTFGNKKKKQTIYAKFEFFHAGKGVKIPMAIATDSEKNAIGKWNITKLDAFKKGYNVSEVYDRLYVPINIYYNTQKRQFVYEISEERKYKEAIVTNNGSELRFNLFELKTCPN